jgi:Protein of unknown function (DUF1822)
MSDLQQYITKRLKTNPEFADNFEAGYAEFKKSVLQELANEKAEIKGKQIASSTPRINILREWFQQIFRPEWELITNNLRSTDGSDKEDAIEREKIIDLGELSDGSRCLVLLVVTLTQETEDKVGIRLEIYPVDSELELPENLRLIVFFDDEKQKEVQPKNNCIRLPKLKGQSGETFTVEISLDDVSIAENFII